MTDLLVDSDELKTWIQSVSNVIAITKVEFEGQSEYLDERLLAIMNLLDRFVKEITKTAEGNPGGNVDE